MPDIWCAWCDRAARFRVSALPARRGAHQACGIHLSRAVQFVTVPEGHADVEVLK